MNDPLGFVSGSAGGIGRVYGPGHCAPEREPTLPPGAPSFKDVLLDNINEVNKLQAEATTAIEDLSTGKRADLEGVLLATQKADTAFRALLSVRNKVQQAYEEIKQLRV